MISQTEKNSVQEISVSEYYFKTPNVTTRDTYDKQGNSIFFRVVFEYVRMNKCQTLHRK